MAKRKMQFAQPSLFKKAFPQMPEGYYSSGPNPNLRRFVKEHAKLYNSEHDDYHIPPFDQPITTNRSTATYNMHRYWSKKPHDAIRQYIRHYTKTGDIVLDPFFGSGGTALAALIEGRATIAIDLSPSATFITKNYCTTVDTEKIEKAYDILKPKIETEINWLYETRCDRCEGQATTSYTVYSYVYQCPRCLEKVPLFDCILMEGEKGKKINACPNCYTREVIEEISTRTKRFGPVPVLVSYLCQEGCKPQRDQRRHNDADQKKREFFKIYDLGKLEEIEEKSIPYWFPPHRMMNVESDIEPWGDKWRAGSSNFRTVADLFTKRNLWALSALKSILDSCEDSIRDPLLFAFSSNILGVSQMVCESNTAILMGTYYIPSISKEVNVLSSYEHKLTTVLEGVREITDQINSTPIIISTDSATNLSSIPSNSIEYIFTDPPYAGNVQYGELNFVWEAWMDFNTKWHDQEIIVNFTRGKSDLDWADMMRHSMQECYRTLKPGRWVSLCYHDTSEGTWQLMQDLMTEVGFIPEKSDETLFIDVGQKSYNQLVADKVTKRDLVINFRKPRPEELTPFAIITGDEDAATFTEKARLILVGTLDTHPGSTADRLYDELVSRMVRKGEFERHNFDEILRSVAEEVNGRWYLLDTAGLVDETESKKETAAAKRLEAYMQKVLSEQRDAMGIHYSDLFEQYLPIKDKPRRLLQDWLPEFFIKTPDGTWRPPANEEERQQKAALRSSGALRRIKRFTNTLVDGVPPADRDKPENAITLADWIRQCRRAGLFELGRVLYEKGGLRFEELNEEMRLLVEEDYQICVGRSEKKKKSRTKGQQLSLQEG